jgi:plastocyanin
MKKAVCLLMLVLSAGALIACGDDSDGESEQDPTTYCPTGDQRSAGGGGETLVVSADPSGDPRFKPTSLQAEAGELTIELKNPSPRCHDIAVKAPDGELFGNTERVKDGTANVALDLEAGEYIYYSTIPGEQDAGMKGTLTVE